MRIGPDIFDDDAMPLELGGLRLRPDGTLPAVTEGPPLAREEKLDVRLHGARAAVDEHAIPAASPVIRCGRRGLESRAPQRRSALAGRYRLFRRDGTARCMREKMVKRDRLSRGEQENGECGPEVRG